MIKEVMMMQKDIKTYILMEDLISNNFLDNINKNGIKRQIWLILMLLILYSIISAGEIIEWYFIIKKSIQYEETALTFFTYRIFPFVYSLQIIFGFVAWSYYIKGQKAILHSFEKDNADTFNKGYVYLNKTTNIYIISYIATAVMLIARLLLTHLL